jgi:DNA repair exonuclease SbcCD ATPase subunit
MDTNDAVDQAALAFDADMGNRPAPQQRGQSDGGKKRPTEAMFDNLGEFTDNSEDSGGGDHLPSPTKAKDPRAKLEYEPDADGDDDEDAGGDDIEYEIDEDGNVVVDEEGLPVEKEKSAKKDGEEDEDEDEELSKLVTVVIDGEEKEVPLREALDGYIRLETFHQRLNKLDEVKQVVSTEAQKVIADRQKLIAGLEDLENQIKALIPAEPDWDALYREDPAKARALEKQYKEVKTQIEKVKTDRETAIKEAAEREAEQTAEFARTEFSKFASSAKWGDAKAMQKDLQAMKRTAESVGFQPEEYGTVYDSRMLEILRRASKYDRMMAARPKPVQNGRKTPNTPGAGRTRTAPNGIDRAQKRLNQTGSIDDAAAVFARLIK